MLKIGERIKELRKAQKVTQEKLADYLDISYQAVSKWENGQALPDVTLLPKLARFFGVSTDWLLDADLSKTDDVIESVRKKAVRYKKEGKRQEAIALLEKTLLEYPNNFLLLADWIELKVRSFAPNGNKADWLEDIRRKSNIVLDHCTDDAVRYKVKTNLAFAYAYCDKREEAELLCDTFPDVAYSKLDMYSMIAPPRERAKYKKNCIGRNLESLFVNMLSIGKQYYCFEDPRRAIPICQMVIDVIDTVGAEGFLIFHKAEALADMANAYAKLQDADNTLRYAERAFYEYVALDNLAETETVYRTPILEGETFGRNKITYWDGRSASQNYFDILSKSHSYDFLRSDATFTVRMEEFQSKCVARSEKVPE